MIVGEPYSGTEVAFYWSFSYDVARNKELTLFRDNTRSWTGESLRKPLLDKQQNQLEEFIKDNENFAELNEHWEELRAIGARPFIDQFGSVYYEIGYHLNPGASFCGIFVLFEYDEENEELFVTDCLYMPYYIEVE